MLDLFAAAMVIMIAVTDHSETDVHKGEKKAWQVSRLFFYNCECAQIIKCCRLYVHAGVLCVVVLFTLQCLLINHLHWQSRCRIWRAGGVLSETRK